MRTPSTSRNRSAPFGPSPRPSPSGRPQPPRAYRQAETEENDMSTTSDHFSTDATGLPEARPPELVELADGDHLDLRIAPVAKRIGDATVRMLAYNGSIPGPILKVQEGAEVVVNVENQGD